jgi:hypothetical protein
MATCLNWLVYLLLASGVLKVVAMVWCVYDLRGKSIPELWGIDWLDIVYRIERIHHAARNAAGLNVWKLWVINEFSLSRCSVEIFARQSSMAARKSGNVP